MLDQYRLTSEEAAEIKAQGWPEPVALGWLKAKRLAAGHPLESGDPLLDLIAAGNNPLFDLFKPANPKPGG